MHSMQLAINYMACSAYYGLRMYDREWAFSALSLLLSLNQPGDIVIVINNSAVIINVNALWKSLG